MWLRFILYSLVLSSALCQIQTPVVNIQQGSVSGTLAESGNYYEFHGIPYADSTSGIHRFKAPSPPPSFQDTFVANRRDIKCVRALGVGYEGTEDCLVVDIYTPALDVTRQLSVMVWIKGREFDQDSQHDFSFSQFIEKDVVIVDLNYRESILGFLCLGTEAAPGNAGLKDIIAGLRWVQQNIAQFGGNPNDITLFGHGSGAAAVDLVTLSPSAEGLVHKAIAQSGNALAPWAVTRDNLHYALAVAEGLGHTITNLDQLSDVFERTSVSALMAVINELDLTDNSLAFAPCVERSDLDGEEPFLVKSPYQIISGNEFLQIPFIAGYVDREGTIRSEEAIENNWIQRMESSFSDFIQADLEFENEEDEENVAQEIRSFYFQDQAITINNIDPYLTYHGDTMILVSAIREVRMRASGSQNVYLYQFSYKGTLGEAFEGPINTNLAGHSEELAYMFYIDSDEETPLLDLVIGDIIVERWTNFAKTGVPTSETSDVIWQPFTTLNAFYLRILDDDEMNLEQDGTMELSLENPHPNAITFWESIYADHFADAEGRWDVDERDDDDDDVIIVSGEDDEDNNPDGGSNPDGENPDENLPDSEDGSDGDEDDENNSASTTFGYTFLIATLFGLLSKFHSSLLMS